MRLTRTTYRGFGGGSLDFICLECCTPRHVQRSEEVPSTAAGPKADVSTVIAVNAFEAAGLGYEKYVLMCQGLNIPLMSHP